jgi:hypothetical protein
MVFAPGGGTPFEPPPDPEVKPRRGGVVRATEPGQRRLAWRAIVHAGDRDSVQHTEWHLAACSNTRDEAAHCPEGQQLMHGIGEPEGHCLVDGRCGRCYAAG